MANSDETPIVEVFRYHLWANQRLFRFCEGLTPGQLASSTPGTYGAIYDTLRHLVVSEQWYVGDMLGRPRENPIDRGERPQASDLTLHAEHTGQRLVQIARGLSMPALARWSDRGRDESMLAIRLAIQTLDHASEPRTQIRTILSQIGVTPPELDGWAYDAVQPDKGDYLNEGARNG